MTEPAFSIAVVGAGPAGLASALLLADRGHRVTLIGPRAVSADSRTTALLGPTVAALKTIGVWDEAVGAAAPLRVMRIIDGTSRLWRAPPVAFDSAEMGLDAFGWNIPNGALTAALERAVAASTVRRIEANATVGEIGPDGIDLSVDGDKTLRFHLVVAADGRRSRLRDAAGIETRDWTYPQTALTASFSHTRPHGDVSTEFHTETGPFTLVPLPGRRSSLVWIVEPAEAERLHALDDVAIALAIERKGQSMLGKLTLDPGRAVWPMAGMTARHFAARRVALVGETAHVFPPIGAQGFNLTMRDALDLADVLPSDGDPGAPEVMDAYDRARRSDVTMRTTAVDLLNRSLLSDLLPVQGLRGLGLYLLDRVGPLRRAVMREGLGARS